MFGPTFANLGNLQTENAIIIKESDHMGKIFFKDLYGSLKLNVCEYTFEGHDEVVAYLSVPFASTLVFASIMKHQDAPAPPSRNTWPSPADYSPKTTTC